MLYELLRTLPRGLGASTLAQKVRFGHRKCRNEAASLKHSAVRPLAAPGLSWPGSGAPGVLLSCSVPPGRISEKSRTSLAQVSRGGWAPIFQISPLSWAQRGVGYYSKNPTSLEKVAVKSPNFKPNSLDSK